MRTGLLLVVVTCVASVPAWEGEGLGRHHAHHHSHLKHHDRYDDDHLGWGKTHIRPTWQEFVDVVTSLSQAPDFRPELERHEAEYKDMMQPMLDVTETFPCQHAHDSYGTRRARANSVDTLTPYDIDVVAAIGDSITAGNGINAITVAGVTKQFRGYSWSVGGEVAYADDSTTIPNILKHYNPDVSGYSLDTGKADVYEDARLNVAVPGSIARDLPDQAHHLVELLKDQEKDFGPWKLITLFIGGNDLCRYCNDPEVLSAENFAHHIKTALDILEWNLGNVFINVVGMFDVTPLGQMDKGFTCRTLDSVLCPCGTDSTEQKSVQQAVKDYDQHVVSMLEDAPYLNKRPDFAVIYQPFAVDNDIPRKPDGKADLSFFAPDCFHFSRRGHNIFSKFLWRAMFEPVGSKSTTSDYDMELYCPAKDEYLRTIRNSEVGWVPEVPITCIDLPEKVNRLYIQWRLPVIFACAFVGSLFVSILAIAIYRLTRKPNRQKTKPNEKDAKPLLL